MPSFPAQINYLGTPLSETEVEDIIANKKSQAVDLHKAILNSFFEIEIQHLSHEVLRRYVELSPIDNYHPIIPHTERLITRLFSPLKSAKRCYCLGEYLATIELAAHVAEMLATLLWEMTPVNYNGKVVDRSFEKDALGDEFERLGQYRRINALRAFNLIDQLQFDAFNCLRTTRKKYFHLWSGDFSRIKEDACASYFKIMDLIKGILRIGLSTQHSGTVSMNTLLLKYMQDNRDAT